MTSNPMEFPNNEASIKRRSRTYWIIEEIFK